MSITFSTVDSDEIHTVVGRAAPPTSWCAASRSTPSWPPPPRCSPAPERLRRRAQHQRRPGHPRPARQPAGGQREGGRAGHPLRRCGRLRGPPLGVLPEELLLPGHAEGLPDLPVRPPHRVGGDDRAARRPRGRPGAGPPGGGHRQVHPRRRVRAHRGRRPLPRRLQPGRRPAAGDRLAAPRAHPRAGPPVRLRAAGDPGGRRRLRREDGGGVAAGRRQRLGPPGRHRRPRHPLRDQERQLPAQPGPGHRARGPAPGRPPRRRRAGHPADPQLGRGRRAHPHPPLQGGGRGLPVLPRARPAAGRSRPGLGRGDLGRPAAHARGPAPGPGRGRLGHPARRDRRPRRRARPGRPGPRRHRRGGRPGAGARPRQPEPGRSTAAPRWRPSAWPPSSPWRPPTP